METEFLVQLGKPTHTGAGLWATVTRLAKRAGRAHVAVAYLGHDATVVLPLKEGDVLVVDMSKGTVQAGATDPREVRKYLKAGVRVYTCTNLHAKVFVFDETVIAGSANASRSGLIEAAVLCPNRRIADAARRFVSGLALDPVREKWVEKCIGWYVASPRRAMRRMAATAATPSFCRVWLVRVDDGEWDEWEEAVVAKRIRVASKRLADPAECEVESFIWDRTDRFGEQVRQGDLVVQVYASAGRTRVYPPCRVLDVSRHPVPAHPASGWWSISVEQPIKPDTKLWRELKSTLRSAGLAGPQPVFARELRSAGAKAAVLGLWARSR